MIANSLNIKGLQQGNSREALSFQSQSINSKNPQREKHLEYTKHRQRYLQILFSLFFVAIVTPNFAQSGLTCNLAKNLGSGASYSNTENFNMPSGELWMKYTNPAGPVRITMTPSSTGGANSLKFEEITFLIDSCGGRQIFTYNFDITQVVTFNYLLSIPVYSNVYIYAKRYINSGCGGCDTAYNSFNIDILSNNSLMASTSCIASQCPNNLVANGDFEEYTNLIDFNTDWNGNVCGWNNVFGLFPDYYNGDNTTFIDVDLPGIGTGFPPASGKYYIDIPPVNNWYTGAATNQAVVGLSLDDSYNDVITGNLSSNLISSKKYFLSFDATNSGRPNYAGRLDIDLSDDINYDPTASDFNIVDLQFNGNPGTFKANWQTFETVITASGNESYIHIGNLLPTTNNTVTPQTAYVNGTDQEYIFIDNLVVTQLAFAGDDISLCPGATAILGPDCPIPGATYVWDASANLSATNIPNPTVTGTGTATNYTVTVSYTIGGTTYTDVDVVNVGASGISVTLGASPLVLTSAGTTVLTALPAGAGTYAFYDMASPGTILQNTSSNTFTTGTLSATTSYGVILTDANGCTAQTSIEIIYTTTPCNSGSPLNHISSNSTSQLTAGPYSGEAFDVSNGFTFNSDVTFTNCEFWIRDGATININSTRSVDLIYCTVRQCDKMWNRINNRGNLNADHTRFTQGDRAVVMKNGSDNIFVDCEFYDNVYGISSIDTSTVQTVGLVVTGTEFRNLNGFVTGYTGQTTFHTLPAAGIQLRDLSPQTIGDDAEDPNLFKNQYLGVINSSTDLIINNSFFDEMVIFNPNTNTPPAPTSTNVAPYIYSGIAIYSIQGSTGAFLTTINGAPSQDFGANSTIKGAEYKAIYSQGIATDVLNVNITDCTVGINFHTLLPNFESRVLNCNLNVSYTGMAFFGSTTTSTIIAQENFVEINPVGGLTGLSCIRVDNQGGTSNNANIRLIANDLESSGSHNGIYLQNCAGGGTYVSCNTITKLFDGAFRGIQVNNAGGSVIKTNTITSVNPHTNAGNGVTSNSGIELNLSPSLRVSCNITNNQFIGINFNGNNAGSGPYLSGNNMGTHKWGLYYSATATVGHCDHRGNLWTQAAPSGGFHARNDNFAQPFPCVTNSATQYALNRIRTGTANGSSTNLTTSFPAGSPNVANPCTTGVVALNNTGWITNVPAVADYDSCGVEEDSCAIWMSMRSSENTEEMEIMIQPENMEEMEMMAQSENFATVFNTESSYMVKQTLYDLLDDHPEKLEDSEVLDSLYTALQYSSTGKNKHVNDLIKQGSSGYLLSALHTNIVNLREAAGMLAYTIKCNGNVTNAKLNYNYYLTENQALNDEINALKLYKRTLANLNNNAITPDNIVSSNNKAINDIYLNQIFGVDTVDLSCCLATLLSIANQCPLAGGPAVYWARGIYEMVVPGIVYNDDSVCTTVSNERRGVDANSNSVLANNPVESESIITYPNPTDGIFNIEVENTYLNAIAQIYDVLGKVVFEQKITNVKSTLDLSSLNKGTYIISIRSEAGNIYRNKISLN
jgi:hypothetical protein